MNYILNRIPENVLKDFDRDLQLFYNHVLSKELDSLDSFAILRVKKALKDVVHAYKKQTVESLTSSILFDSLEKRYAYILKHCPCFTSAVARHFHHLLSSNPFILDAAVQNRQLKVCCLGGGPATDAVAIAKVVNALNSCFVNGDKSKLLLRVTVVDLSGEWETTAKKVLQTVQETPEFCDEEKISVNFEFLKADLTEKWGEPVRNIIHDADIVTMVYFVSAVNGSKVKNECSPMLQNIMHALKPGALLFFLDSAKDLHYKSILSASCSFKNLKQVYGPYLQEFHTLSMKSIKKFIELYSTHFNVTMCLTNCFVSCAGWIKVETMLSALSIISVFRNELYMDNLSSNLSQNSLRKIMAFNTKKQEHFRQKIEKLFLCDFERDFDTKDLDDSEDIFEIDSWNSGKIMLCPTKSKRKRIFAGLDSEISVWSIRHSYGEAVKFLR